MAWTWTAASCRGTSHLKTGTRCQDAFRCTSQREDEILVAVVSDGAGSASHGGEGASLVCRTFSERAREHFSGTGDLPDDDTIWSWMDEIRDRIAAAAGRRGMRSRDFAATLVSVIAGGSDTIVMAVGDGAAVVRSGPESGWIVPDWPEHGEYASTTFFVIDEPAPRMRIVRLGSAIEDAALFTDGIERLALDFAGRRAHQPFFESMIKPLKASTAIGRDAALARALAAYLDGDAVNARTDDDKTLLLAIRR